MTTAAPAINSTLRRTSRLAFADRDDVQLTAMIAASSFLVSGQLAIHTSVSGAANSLAAQAILFIALPLLLLVVAFAQSLVGRGLGGIFRALNGGVLSFLCGASAVALMAATQLVVAWMRGA
jgi:hypothetical protein